MAHHDANADSTPFCQSRESGSFVIFKTFGAGLIASLRDRVTPDVIPQAMPSSLCSELMSLALTVEWDGNDFHWVILESFDHSMVFESLVEASTTFPTYLQALEAGYEMLKSFSADLNQCPQDAGDPLTAE